MKTIAIGILVLICTVTLLAWSPPAKAGQAVVTCYVVDVATYGDRVHIHCAPPVSGCSLAAGNCQPAAAAQPLYFAVETGSPMAASVVHSGLAGLINKRSLEISYDDDPDQNPAGCQPNDCRRIVGVVIR